MRAPVDKHSPFLHGWRSKARTAVLSGAERAGFRLERLEDTETFVPDDATHSPQLMTRAASVPGMVSMRRGMYYYWMAYAGVPGDVIELGCWQGRSTTFLAQACKDTGNGVVHTVDTFGGNPGNEAAYRVGANDLSDLAANFTSNMRRLGLADQVRTYRGRSVDRARDVLSAANGVRLLVVDAEHTYDAVRGELAAYADALAPGGLLVLDDYSRSFPGVAQAVNEHLDASGRYATPMQDHNLLVARRVR